MLYMILFASKFCFLQSIFFAASYPKVTKGNYFLPISLIKFSDIQLDNNKLLSDEDILWSNIIERIHRLKDSCGDLCNTEKEIKEGEFLGTVESNVSISHFLNPCLTLLLLTFELISFELDKL